MLHRGGRHTVRFPPHPADMTPEEQEASVKFVISQTWSPSPNNPFIETALQGVLDRLRNVPVIGNAYSDYDLNKNYWNFTITALQLNCPDIAYTALDELGVRVMGVRLFSGWEEFVADLSGIIFH